MIDCDKVPKRDLNITPYEMLMSETQERMLLVLDNRNNKTIKEILKKWNLETNKIGEVIKEESFIIKSKNKIVVNLPVSILTDDCPMYKRPVKKPKKVKGSKKLNLSKLK